ncbi:armadillo-type protein [Globomyces pollinis-pini]|nr:armadillo-type protein [Globomyces pollinis-pini]
MNGIEPDWNCFEQSEIEINGSCSRRNQLSPKELPAIFNPLNLMDLYIHVKRVMASDTADVESIPVHNNSHNYIYNFLAYFINVHIQHEQLFKQQKETIELLFRHIQSVSLELIRKISVIQRSKYIEDLLLIVMQLIRIFSRLDEIAELIGNEGGIDLIFKSMKALPLFIQLQINCSACLANLATVESNRKLMLTGGCIGHVLENMLKFMKYPAVQAEICATLANLACHKLPSTFIAANNGTELILKALRIHIDKADLQIQGFHAFASLGKECVPALEREDFLKLAIKSMELHADNVDLVSAAWHALGSLSNNGLSITVNKDRLLELIFTSMKVYQNNPTFQITACFALAHMFFNNRDGDEEVSVEKYQGIEFILNTMNKFKTQQSLQTTSLFALGSIVMKSDVHRKSIIKYNGIDTILHSMMRKYTTDVSADEKSTPEPVLYSRGNSKIQCSKPLLLQLFASVCLLNLSECTKCRDIIVSKGGIQAIVEASKKVREHSDLWFIVYYVFTKFTKCGDTRMVFLKSKKFPTLKELTKTAIVGQNLPVLQTQKGKDFNLDTYRQILYEAVNSPVLLSDLKWEISNTEPCKFCYSGCYEGEVVGYEIHPALSRTSSAYRYCSIECAKKEEKFADKKLFYYSEIVWEQY